MCTCRSQRRSRTSVPLAVSLSPVAFGSAAAIFVKRTPYSVNANLSVTSQPAFESLPGTKQGDGFLEL